MFSFYAGDLGSYMFNRVAMGALNSSIYTQRMVQQMFEGVTKSDGKPLLGNGLMVATDDILCWGDSEEEMLEVLELFLRASVSHNLAIHPKRQKCELFITSTIYCGLKISREGITVDPVRVKGLQEVEQPKTVGDVWQFNAGANWIREDIPLLSKPAAVLTQFRVNALKHKKRKNMQAAQKITLAQAGWKREHQEAWEQIKAMMLQAITTSFRDKRKRACIFTDASTEGWCYTITQCEPGELEKPWSEQRHQLLAVNSGKFRNSQIGWNMSCKEAYPIRHAVERHRHLLMGNMPFASVNDHKTLTYVLDEPTRVSAISVAARDRLRRWAEYLRSYTFDTVHIPGAENHFCDLLSRNGCSRAVSTWKEEKARQERLEQAVARKVLPQMAIIKPDVLMKSKNASKKDLDVTGPDLMPTVSTEHWPVTKRLHEAQIDHGVKTDHVKKSSSYPLYVNERGKIVLPKEHPVTLEVIAVCHQGDLVHRSAMDTLKEFREHYVLLGMGRKAEEEFIKALCRKCLSCIKTKTGNTIPRPMWYMVYALSLIHI